MRRAAEKGDGWLPQGPPQMGMKKAVQFIKEHRAATRGDEPIDLGINTESIYVGEPSFELAKYDLSGSADKIAERLRSYAGLGINQLQIRFRSRSADELCDQIRAFGADVGPALNHVGDPMLLEGKVAVVSGLGPGMGRDISIALATEGADIVMCARSEERMSVVAAEVAELGRRAVTVQCDITSKADCERVADTAKEELGHVDILVNNAFHQGDFSLFENANLEDWRTTFDVNLFGSLQLTQSLLPLLKESGRWARHHDQHAIRADRRAVVRRVRRVEGGARDRDANAGS